MRQQLDFILRGVVERNPIEDVINRLRQIVHEVEVVNQRTIRQRFRRVDDNFLRLAEFADRFVVQTQSSCPPPNFAAIVRAQVGLITVGVNFSRVEEIMARRKIDSAFDFGRRVQNFQLVTDGVGYGVPNQKRHQTGRVVVVVMVNAHGRGRRREVGVGVNFFAAINFAEETASRDEVIRRNRRARHDVRS